MCKGKSFVSICVRAKWKESVDIMGKKARVFYVLFLVWLIWGMLSLSFPEPQPERMLTELYIGTITEYEQPPAGLQFVIDPFYPFSKLALKKNVSSPLHNTALILQQ